MVLFGCYLASIRGQLGGPGSCSSSTSCHDFRRSSLLKTLSGNSMNVILSLPPAVARWHIYQLLLRISKKSKMGNRLKYWVLGRSGRIPKPFVADRIWEPRWLDPSEPATPALPESGQGPPRRSCHEGAVPNKGPR